MPYLEPLHALLEDYFVALNNTIETHIEELRADLGDDQLVSGALNRLKLRIEQIHYFLSEVLNTHNNISRELYYLAEWYFSEPKSRGVKAGYVFFIGQSLSTASFKEILFARVGEIYRELCDEFTDVNFHFVRIPPQFSQRDQCHNWPLILHEFGHILEFQMCSLADAFPSLANNLYFELVQMGMSGHPTAIDKLHAVEFLADYLALRRIGPAFIRRYHRNYSTMATMLDTSVTHPSHEARFEEALQALESEGGYREVCSRLRSEVQPTVLTGKPADTARNAARNARKKFLPILPLASHQVFLEEIGRVPEQRLLRDILDLKPVIKSPQCLYTLIALCDDFEDKPKLPALIADCLRLWIIAQKFPAIMQ